MRIKCCRRRRRRRRRCCSYPCTPASAPPVIIPIAMQASTAAPQRPPLQITEYVQDIYPPAEVYAKQIPVVCLLIVQT